MSEAPNSRFIYVTYIRTTPEKLWNALTDPATMREYWFGMYGESDFKAGSPWRLLSSEGRALGAGQVLEAEPPQRLALHWRSEYNEDHKAEGISTCIFTLEPANGAVKLTVDHSIGVGQSKMIHGVSEGWPPILSNLKSLLETGAIAYSR